MNLTIETEKVLTPNLEFFQIYLFICLFVCLFLRQGLGV
jgi:hypothetical protein